MKVKGNSQGELDWLLTASQTVNYRVGIPGAASVSLTSFDLLLTNSSVQRRLACRWQARQHNILEILKLPVHDGEHAMAWGKNMIQSPEPNSYILSNVTSRQSTSWHGKPKDAKLTKNPRQAEERESEERIEIQLTTMKGPFRGCRTDRREKKPPRQAELKQRKILRAPTELSSSFAGQDAGISKKPSSISLVMLKYCKSKARMFSFTALVPLWGGLDSLGEKESM